MEDVEAPRFLLLLPPLPNPPDVPSLKAAFGETVAQVLKEVASQSSQSTRAAVLEIAVACPHLCGTQNSSRSSLYAATQTIVSGVYRLVCIIAAQDDINVEDADGVDVRVITLAWSPDRPDQVASGSSGSVIDLSSLALSGRQWQFAFGVESEAGEALVRAFVIAKGSGAQISQVQSDSVANVEHASDDQARSTPTSASSQSNSVQRHHHVAVGGTFDHIHIGHKLLLNMTIFSVDLAQDTHTECSATIGITGDQLLVNKKFAQVLESWEDRQSSVKSFVDGVLHFTNEPAIVSRRNDPVPNGKSVDLHYPGIMTVKCTEIQDPFGPTITEEQIGALVISAETRAGGKAVNDKRKEKGWHELEVLEVDVLDADEASSTSKQDQAGFDSKISSTAIREKVAKKLGRL